MYKELKDDFLFSLYAQGKNDYEVAGIVHVGRNRLRAWRERHGIASRTNKKNLDDSFLVRAQSLLEKGYGLSCIGEKLGVHRTSIARLFKKHGIEYPSRNRSVPSMRYKLDGSEKPVDQDIVDLHVHLQKIAGRPIRFFGDDILVQKIKRSCSDIRSRKDIYVEFIRRAISQARQISRTEFRKMPSDKELRAMFASGKTDRQIAHMYGMGRGRICAVRKRLGIRNYWARLKEKNGNTIH